MIRLSTRVSAVVGCLVLLTGCGGVPPTPGTDTWQTHAVRTLGTVVSSLSTVALVLKTDEHDRLIGFYGSVTLVSAEDAAGTSAQTFSAEQPPREEQDRGARITTLLDDATGLLQDVRIAYVNGDPGLCAKYCSRLNALADSLGQIEEQLSKTASRADAGKVARA